MFCVIAKRYPTTLIRLLHQEYFPTELEVPIKARFRRSLTFLHDLGASVTSISLPSTKYALSAYYVIAGAEANSNLAIYDGVRWFVFYLRSSLDVCDPEFPILFAQTLDAG